MNAFVRIGGVLFIACLVSLPGASAEAASDEDGGLRSPLAWGAGNRALAMGGAQTAVVADASAVIWNPAGLARVPRSELQATSSSLYGLDVSEQYGGLAVPSWRWGTAALAFRRFAVGGIERRDDRNVLLSEFDDSETELSLAYGRPVGEAWTIGGAAKMQRQKIAEYDDVGLGLDLGVQVLPGVAAGRTGAWARRLRLGLAVRNLVEPTVRLDQESVADPTSLRAGLAWSQAVLGSRSVVAAVDMEKAKSVNADLRAGLEAQVHPMLALRGGWNGEGMTAGCGIRWRGYAFDYVLEDNEIESVHRFGATLAFGATTAETRLAMERREEEDFRVRLAETFRTRQEARASELATRAETLLDERRWDEALDAAATLAALAPDDERGVDLQSRALSRKALLAEMGQDFAEAAILYGRVLAIAPGLEDAEAGLARCRDESDRRAARSARIRDLFALALDSFTSGDMTGARTRLREILALSPDDSEARTMLNRTEASISARVSTLLARAGRSIERGLLGDAEAALDEARGLDATAAGIDGLTRRLTRAERTLAAETQRRASEMESLRQAQEAAGVGAGEIVAIAPTPKAPVLSQKKRREIADLYRRGMEAMQESRAEDALRYWELVWMADPDHENVADYLKREYLLRGLESFSRGGLDEAIRLWERALEVTPGDEKTLGYLARAREQRDRTREILGNRP